MKKNEYAIGLGEPEPQGKQSLFRPAVKEKAAQVNLPAAMEQGSRTRMRTTIELSVHTLELIQNIQTRSRAKTGKALPIWKLIGLAVESYAKSAHPQGEENLR